MAGLNVEKRGTKWRYRFDVAGENGKRVRVGEGGFNTKKDAVAAGTKALAEFNKVGLRFRPSEISFSDYLDKWLNEYCTPNLKPETISQYEKKIRVHIKPALGKYKLKSITASLLQEFVNMKFQQGYSRNTLVCIKGVLTGCFRYAVEPLRFIEHSPMAYVKLPSSRARAETPTRSEPHVFIKQEQMDAIFKRFPEESTAHLPLQLGYRCGLRIGEAFAVLWNDIDIERKLLSVNRQVQWDASRGLWYFSEPKYESFRTIDIDKDLLELLKREYDRQQSARLYYGARFIRLYEGERRHINTDGDGDEIFPLMIRPNGTYIQPRIMQHTSSIIHYNMKFKEFDFHSLRHTHATMLLDNGAPLKYVQHRLGHKKPDITIDVYQHTTDTAMEKGLEILDNMLTVDEKE